MGVGRSGRTGFEQQLNSSSLSELETGWKTKIYKGRDLFCLKIYHSVEGPGQEKAQLQHKSLPSDASRAMGGPRLRDY